MAEGGRGSTFPTEGALGSDIIRFRVVPGPTVHSATFVLGDEVIKGEGKPTAVQVFQKGLKDLSKICDMLLDSVPDVPRPSPTVADLST